MRLFFDLLVHTRDDYLFTNMCLKSKMRQINKIEQIKRDEIGKQRENNRIKNTGNKKKKSFRRISKENKYRVLMD